MKSFRARQGHATSTMNEWNSQDKNMFVDCIVSSCRSFNLRAHVSRLLASDHKCISVDPHRPAATFGLAMVVVDSILRCVVFFSRALRAIKWLSEAAHLCKSSYTPLPQNVEQSRSHRYPPKFYLRIICTLVSYRKIYKGKSLAGRATVWAIALWWLW